MWPDCWRPIREAIYLPTILAIIITCFYTHLHKRIYNRKHMQFVLVINGVDFYLLLYLPIFFFYLLCNMDYLRMFDVDKSARVHFYLVVILIEWVHQTVVFFFEFQINLN